MRIAMVSEGTYPFEMGGVSVWCDQLIRGLPEHEWEFVALVADGSERARWELPPNLRALHTIPLWGGGGRRGRRSTAHPDFLEAYRQFASLLVRPLGDSKRDSAADRATALAALRDLFEVGRRHGDPGDVFSTDEAVDVLVDQWTAQNVARISLADVLDFSVLLDHLMRPLFAEPVRVDLVHSSMNGLSMLAALAAKWAHGTPVVMSEHGIYLRERYLMPDVFKVSTATRFLQLNFFRIIAEAAYLGSDALAPHSRYNRRWQLRGGASSARMWTMYNGVEPDLFPSAVDEPDLPTIVFLGRIDPIKDLHTLIQAFALVRREVPDARLRIFGGTPASNEGYRVSCETLIQSLGLQGAAVLEGPAESQVAAYHSGSIVALSSVSEGFPFTVVEAMACGRTVVCTNVGGVSEAVADAGIVVPPRDSKAFGAACVELLQDHDRRRRLGARARERVHASFTLEQSLAAYDELYRRVSNGRGSRSAVSAKQLVVV